MLDLMRKKSRSLLTYILFSIIIVVFVFTFNTSGGGGPCSGGKGKQLPGELVAVNDTPIDGVLLQMAQRLTADPPSPRRNDNRALQQKLTYKRYRFVGLLRLGYDMKYPEFGVDMQLTSPIKIEKTMDDLIETLLVGTEARQAGLHVSTKELEDRIVLDRHFDEETGEFKKALWEQELRNQTGLGVAAFEEFMRLELLREKMITLLTESIEITDTELEFHHKMENEKVDLGYVDVTVAAATELVPVSDADVAAWQGEHEAEIAKYYADNEREFKKDRRVVLRGIKINAPNRRIVDQDDAAAVAKLEADRKTARDKADKVLAELKEKAAAKTGDAGDAGEAPAPAAANGAQPAPPAAAGTEPAAAPAAEAPAAADAPPAEAPDSAVPSVAVETFAEVAEASSDHAETKATGGLFSEPRTKAQLGRWPFGPEAAEAVFGLQTGQITGVVEVDDGFWILRADEFIEAVSRTLDQARGEIAGKLLRREKVEDFRDTLADEILAEAKKDTTKGLEEVVDAVTARYGVDADVEPLAVKQTGLFSRVRAGSMGSFARFGFVPGLGLAPELTKAAFAASEDAPLLDGVFKGENGDRRIIARFAGREDAGEMDPAAMKETADQLRRERQRIFYLGWYKTLRDKATENGEITVTAEWQATLNEQRLAYQQQLEELNNSSRTPGTKTPSDAPGG